MPSEGTATRDEIAAHASTIADLRIIDTLEAFFSKQELLALLERKAEESKGMANRAIRAHICRITLVEIIATSSGDSKLFSLAQVSKTLYNLVDEDQLQSQAPKSSALRMLLAVSCQEAMKEGDANNCTKHIQFVRLQMLCHGLHVRWSKTSLCQWINPSEEWVAERGSKHAIQAEVSCDDGPAELRLMAITCIYADAMKVAGQLEQVGAMEGDLPHLWCLKGETCCIWTRSHHDDPQKHFAGVQSHQHVQRCKLAQVK